MANKLQKIADKIYGQNQSTVKFNRKTKTYWLKGNNMGFPEELGNKEKAEEKLNSRLDFKNMVLAEM